MTAESGKLEPAELARKLWAKDPGLWSTDAGTQKEIADRLGWLRVAAAMEPRAGDLMAFARQAAKDGFTRALLLGMGGSSLAPLVFQSVAGSTGALEVEVVDTTDPAGIRAADARGDYAKTLFIVSSKSGGTIEVDSLLRHFWKEAGEKGDRFIAITDPGTELDRKAREMKFRRAFLNFPDIGGRYSALSYFGLVPAALCGVNVPELLARAVRMMRACDVSSPASNPGLSLGLAMGRAWEKGRDKVTLALSPKLASLGLWVEQLLAESTGKCGKGLVPVAGEPISGPEAYSSDRLFVGVTLAGDDAEEAKLAALEAAGHPVERLRMKDPLDLGAEFFRWEFATAVAGAYMVINPFDQPDVALAKKKTKEKLKELADTGSFTEPPEGDAEAEIRGALAGLEPGKDYAALLAFLPYGEAVERPLRSLQAAIRDRHKVACTFGFGPRYLHSTGQLHKGGAKNGVAFIFSCVHADDLEIPGQPYSFGKLERAQALGDWTAHSEDGRRVVFIRLPDASPASVEKAAALFGL